MTQLFALYNAAGTVAYELSHGSGLLPPTYAAWRQEPVDEAIDGTPIYGLYAEVTWDFSGYERGVPVSLVDLLQSLRAADGTIRFKTVNAARVPVVCTGKIDIYQAYTHNSAHGSSARARGLVVRFTRVVAV